VKHNLKTRGIFEGVKGGWYLAHDGSFRNAGTEASATRTEADGWSQADRWSFHEWLMGWDFVSKV
jgi:hypothetical protein